MKRPNLDVKDLVFVAVLAVCVYGFAVFLANAPPPVKQPPLTTGEWDGVTVMFLGIMGLGAWALVSRPVRSCDYCGARLGGLYRVVSMSWSGRLLQRSVYHRFCNDRETVAFFAGGGKPKA